MTKYNNKSSLLYNYTIADKNDTILKKSRLKKCNSYVANFISLLRNAFYNYSFAWWPGTLTKTTDGSVYRPSTQNLLVSSTTGDITQGLVVGSGDTAVDIEDYSLETIIANGTSAGQLQYSAVTFGAPTETSTVAKFIVTRTFTNGSGGDVTIKEIGLIGRGNYDSLLIRDVLTSPETIAHTEKITFNYTLQTSL